MDRDGTLAADIPMQLHRLCGVDMLSLHEPARRIGTDGNGGQIDRACPATDLGKLVGIARIAREPEAKALMVHDPAAPERSVTVPQRPRTPVPCRHKGEQGTP